MFYMVMHSLILFLMTLKMLFYIQVFMDYSKLVTLIKNCLSDIVPFMSFYVAMLFITTLFYIISGIEIGDENDYKNMPKSLRTFM